MVVQAFRVDDLPIESGMLTDALDNAQRKVEAYFFDIRKQLWEYDQVRPASHAVLQRHGRSQANVQSGNHVPGISRERCLRSLAFGHPAALASRLQASHPDVGSVHPRILLIICVKKTKGARPPCPHALAARGTASVQLSGRCAKVRQLRQLRRWLQTCGGSSVRPKCAGRHPARARRCRLRGRHHGHVKCSTGCFGLR